MKAVIFILIMVITPLNVTASPRFYFGGGVGLSSIKNSSANSLNQGSLILSGLSTIYEVDDIFNQGCERKSYTIPIGNIFVGIRLNRYFGVEAGYSINLQPVKFLFKEKSLDDNQIDVYGFYKQHSEYFDLIGYLPLVKGIDLLLSFGIIKSVYSFTYNVDSNYSHYDYNIKESIIQSLKKSECSFNPRLGIGFSYELNKTISLRAMLRHKLSGCFNMKKSGALFKDSSSLSFEVMLHF